jgi:membrane protease YdiL (CAAX protease family)
VKLEHEEDPSDRPSDTPRSPSSKRCDPTPPQLTVRSVLLFYGGMAVVAGIWMAWLDEDNRLPLANGETWARDLGLGLALTALTVAAGPVLRWAIPSYRELEGKLRALLGRPGTGAIFVFAAMSGLGEELLFRGALQPAAGYVVASVAFGLVHGFFAPGWRVWTVFALALGFALGGLALATDNLLAPMTAHFAINFVNMHLLCRAGDGR